MPTQIVDNRGNTLPLNMRVPADLRKWLDKKAPNSVTALVIGVLNDYRAWVEEQEGKK